MRYGGVEYAYAAPIAGALVEDASFRSWFLSQTEFERFRDARLLHEEMKSRRSTVSENWWRSHFSERCRCAGCSGKETDLLAIFEALSGERFAIHVEIKRPGDSFKSNGVQAKGYPLRALCWTLNPPASVLPHSHATTALIMSEQDRGKFSPHVTHFMTLLTFEQIKEHFPRAAPN
jgi:hypothetical protein